MNAIRSLLIAALGLSLIGCAQAPQRPDNPYFAPVTPAEMAAPKANDGSIYQAGRGVSLFEDAKARRVGDILTVVLTEQTSATKSAGNEIDKESSLTIEAPSIGGNTLQVLGNPLSASLGGGTRAFKGESDASQNNSLSGNITVTVAGVLPNGVLQVRGEKWMTLTNGDEYIRISGLVRPQDISPDNTVPSTKLADARIAYAGTGEFHDASSMGWLSKFFYSTLWPF